MKKGFTLIELLVVVLIIGILSAVAVPMYQKAVLKAKAAEAWTVAKTIIEAEKLYYMENGSFTEFLDKLSIEIPTELKNWRIPTPTGGTPKIYGKNQLEGVTLYVNVSSPYTDIEDGIRCLYSDLCPDLMPCKGSCQTMDVGSGPYQDCTCPL